MRLAYTMEFKKKMNRFLISSLVLVIALCVAVFLLISAYLQYRNQETVRIVGEIYLRKVNERLEIHYETMADFFLSRLRVLQEECPAEQGMPPAAQRSELAAAAPSLGFNEIALINENLEIEYLCGETFDYPEPALLVESAYSAKPTVRFGRNPEGDSVLLFALAAQYPMSDGTTSVGLIGGVPDTHVMDILTLTGGQGLVSSYVILRNGTFVLNENDDSANYFDEVMERYGSTNREAAETVQQYEQDLVAAMEAGETYSAVFFEGVDRLQVYASPLPYSRWYLVTELPFGRLDATVDALGSQWMVMVIGGSAVILAALLFIFWRYRTLSRQQMEALAEARQEAERANRVKSEFFSSMSHDIRTPMNAIVGMTAIASAHLDQTDVVKNSLDKITLSSKQLLGLINDVLDMSKIESGQLNFAMDQMELREFVESIVAMIRPQIEARRQQLDVRVEDIAQETVLCDSIRLNQVLLNLLTNANKYTPDGGRIELRIYERPSALGDDRVQLNLVVRDNGIGMSTEFQKVVYDSFAREDTDRVRRTEGVGLGLAITKYIVEGMGGSIELKSAPGEGSEFHVRLDLEVCPSGSVDMQLPHWKILVVDDDVDVGRLATAYLQECGAWAEWTFDGANALKQIQRAREAGEPYDVILLDWKLPFMDGIQVARRLREQSGSQTEIVLMSAYDWAEVEADAREVGIRGFIAKPLFRSSLYRGLRSSMMSEAERAVQAGPDFSGRRLLIAEDNELNWEIAEELLGSLGFQLERAENGAAAVERFEHSPAGYYDGILMDVQMPVMDGREATALIRAMDRADAATLPIIAMTADAFSADVKRSMEAGMSAHISKPIDMTQMIRVLTKFFG